jgi:hypothetical protein
MKDAEKIATLRKAIKDVKGAATQGLRAQLMRGDCSLAKSWRIGLHVSERIERICNRAEEWTK